MLPEEALVVAQGGLVGATGPAGTVEVENRGRLLFVGEEHLRKWGKFGVLKCSLCVSFLEYTGFYWCFSVMNNGSWWFGSEN